jgi:outer membrane protein
LSGLAAGVAFAAPPSPLTLKEAHEIALRNHPLISVAELKALASREVYKEARAGFFPVITANAVAVGANSGGTRMEAIGALNSPHIFDRQADGIMISQLITDFGHTANMVGSAKLQAEAAINSAQATQQQILLAVDGSFYAAQQAQAVLKVAQQTIVARQIFLDQVATMATNKLKSELDVTFARVNVDDARLLLSKAQNDFDAGMAQLSDLLGWRTVINYNLVEEPLPAGVSTNVYDFIQQGLRFRPDVLALRNQQDASRKLAFAERDARMPTIAAVGGAGVSPLHDAALQDNYAAGGLVISVPIFAGGLYAARQREAELQADAAGESLRDLEDNVIRDVRVSWLNAQNAFDRYRISQELLKNAQESYDLSQARYKAGISSIVEFNQAELNLISAQISLASTQYEYLIQLSALSYQTGTLR